MSSSQKDIIYLDLDDEITSIIDKLRTSSSKIVALVLPKRAAMLQSSVNMKLLKKAADDTKKNLVLITTESALMPLAAAVGIHVAKTLQSKPEIPNSEVPIDEPSVLDVDDEDTTEPEDFDAKTASTTPVGDLASASDEEPVSKRAKPELTPRPIPLAKKDAEEPIELDNSDSTDDKDDSKPSKADSKKSKNKKLKIPNFERFRVRLILAVVMLIIFIVGFIIANTVLPKASITVATNTSSVNPSLTLNLSTTSKTADITSLTIPASLQQTQKSNSQQVNTTGQKNEGTAATGQVKFTDCTSDGSAVSIPAGTGISANGLTFITQSSVSLATSTFDSHGNCKSTVVSSQTVNVAAQNSGAQYNLPSGTNFNVSSSVSRASEITAVGGTSGGTDNNVQIVTQTDINNATQKITPPDSSIVKTTLSSNLTTAGYYPLPSTFTAGAPNNTSSAGVGDQTSTVTVTQTVTYTMFGVKQSDLQAALDNNIDKQINVSKQSIQNDGLSQATYTVVNQSSTGAQLTMQASATIGPHLDINALKPQVVGKKEGEIKSLISANPDVTTVTVHFSPFWVSSAPKNLNKITIQFNSH